MRIFLLSFAKRYSFFFSSSFTQCLSCSSSVRAGFRNERCFLRAAAACVLCDQKIRFRNARGANQQPLLPFRNRFEDFSFLFLCGRLYDRHERNVASFIQHRNFPAKTLCARARTQNDWSRRRDEQIERNHRHNKRNDNNNHRDRWLHRSAEPESFRLTWS